MALPKTAVASAKAEVPMPRLSAGTTSSIEARRAGTAPAPTVRPRNWRKRQAGTLRTENEMPNSVVQPMADHTDMTMRPLGPLT